MELPVELFGFHREYYTQMIVFYASQKEFGLGIEQFYYFYLHRAHLLQKAISPYQSDF
jgi:hypothetical protein